MIKTATKAATYFVNVETIPPISNTRLNTKPITKINRTAKNDSYKGAPIFSQTMLKKVENQYVMLHLRQYSQNTSPFHSYFLLFTNHIEKGSIDFHILSINLIKTSFLHSK